MQRQLTDRDYDIFSILVADYIASAAPVGSKSIAKQYLGELSPASIRNIMVELTQLGLLSQPHASSGRIPTSKGMRFYVDRLLECRELSSQEMTKIREYCVHNDGNIDLLLNRASGVLASVSQFAGIVTTPDSKMTVLKQLQFVPLSCQQVLGILVSKDGTVQNRLITLQDDITLSDLERISNYCTTSFSGMNLDDALKKIQVELDTDYAQYDKLVKRAMLLSKEVFENAPAQDLCVNGQLQFLDMPGFEEMKKIKDLLLQLEEKRQILHVLSKCKQSNSIQVFIGTESNVHNTELDDICIVGAPYKKHGDIIGALGIIGPMHMDFSKIVPVVDFTAQVVSDILDY